MVVAVGAVEVVAMVVAVTSVAATLVVVTSEVAEDILVLRISAALALGMSRFSRSHPWQSFS